MPQSHMEIAVTIRTLAPGRVTQNIYEEGPQAGTLRTFHSRDPWFPALPAFRPCQLLLVILTPLLWGPPALPHLSFPCGEHSCLACVWQPCSQVRVRHVPACLQAPSIYSSACSVVAPTVGPPSPLYKGHLALLCCHAAQEDRILVPFPSLCSSGPGSWQGLKR